MPLNKRAPMGRLKTHPKFYHHVHRNFTLNMQIHAMNLARGHQLVGACARQCMFGTNTTIECHNLRSPHFTGAAIIEVTIATAMAVVVVNGTSKECECRENGNHVGRNHGGRFMHKGCTSMLVVQPVHLHQHSRADSARKSANMVSAHMVSVALRLPRQVIHVHSL